MRIRKFTLWVGALACLAVVLWAAWTVNSHGFSAREKPAGYEVFLARDLRRIASEPNAKHFQNPFAATPLTPAEAGVYSTEFATGELVK
ncbi:MAG: hypothetical protein ABI833_22620 [Acidobacteriota bacterium]